MQRQPSAPRAPRQDLKILNGVRGGAALYVMLFHAVWLLSAPAGPRKGRTWLGWLRVIVAFLTRYGNPAVLLFFVLSGIVIHLGLARAGASTPFDVKNYARRRLLRLYPPLFGILLFTAGADVLGQSINPAYYVNPTFHAGATPIVDVNTWLHVNQGLLDFVGNLLFTQGLFVTTFGSNGPLWSLAYEGFFYLFYAVAFVSLYQKRGRFAAFGLWGAISLAGMLLWIATDWPIWSWPGYLVIWLAGAAIAEFIAAGFTLPRAGRWLIVSLSGIVIMVALYQKLPYALYESLWGFTLAGFLFVLLGGGSAFVQHFKRWIESLAIFAPMSYTLYLLHFPFFSLMSAAYQSVYNELPASFGLLIPGVLSCLAVAGLIASRLEHIGR